MAYFVYKSIEPEMKVKTFGKIGFYLPAEVLSKVPIHTNLRRWE